MSEWQDISTAPKDGTAIWLWYEGQAFIGYYETADRAWQDKGLWWLKASFRRRASQVDDVYGVYASVVGPTHWQPLPEPPEGSQ